MGGDRGPRPGTRLEGSAALELQDGMAPGATSSGTSFHLPELSSTAAAGWRKVSKRSLPRAPADPFFLLGTSLTTLRKGHGFGNGALNRLHPYRAQGDWRGDQLREGLDLSAFPQPKTLTSLNTVQGNTHTHTLSSQEPNSGSRRLGVSLV